MLSIIVNV